MLILSFVFNIFSIILKMGKFFHQLNLKYKKPTLVNQHLLALYYGVDRQLQINVCLSNNWRILNQMTKNHMLHTESNWSKIQGIEGPMKTTIFMEPLLN